MHELLGVIAAEVTALGATSGIHQVTVSEGPFPAGDDAVYVIEPHEFFLRVPAHDHPAQDQLRRTIGLCVEHPGTESFAQTVATAGRVGARLAITDDSALALNELGLPTHRIRLGYSTIWDVWGGADTPRSLDIVFLGTIDRRRSRNIALDIRAADECSVLLALPPHETMSESQPGVFAGYEKLRLLADAKVIVNMHRESSQSFEWVRALEAMSNGCVVVSEHSTDISPLRPGFDLVLGSASSLFTLSRVLLRHPERLAEIRDHCYETLRSQMAMRESATVLSQLAVDLAVGRPPAVASAAISSFRRLPPPPPYGVVYPWQGDHYINESALLKRALDHLPLEPDHRPVVQMARRDRSPHSIDVIILRSPGWPGFGSALSSLLPQLEGADVVVRLCVDRVLEPKAVPDGVVVHSAESHTGAGGVRNLALYSSDAAQILVLDSTDELLPHAVELLRLRLEESRSDVAYGMVITPDGQITSAHPFEPERLEQANYLASAALWRRSSLLALGGWSEGAGWRGQEVRDLWWRLGTSWRIGFSDPAPARPADMWTGYQRTARRRCGGNRETRTLARGLRVSARIHPDDFIYQFVAGPPPSGQFT